MEGEGGKWGRDRGREGVRKKRRRYLDIKESVCYMYVKLTPHRVDLIWILIHTNPGLVEGWG